MWESCLELIVEFTEVWTSLEQPQERKTSFSLREGPLWGRRGQRVLQKRTRL